ncbi:hypothetical protein M9H77_31812 [Catharanthus roseus]|uniref:Uncharacterized protein n=1 Tax=Catharanthus roseus TaxID=4058 RepID=A0ACC0A134_CATRO|nr:hypothetical protein M9H77_31812 [Catharanthus roseus]
MNEGLNSVRDIVCNLASNVEIGQKAMMEDLKTILGTFMSSFVTTAHEARQNVDVRVDLDEMKDEVVGSENFDSKQVNSEDDKEDTSIDEDAHNFKMSMNDVKKKLVLNNISIGYRKILLGIIWNDRY